MSIDAYNMQATAQCGVPLQVLEDRVRELGLTTGHSPQSKPVAHMGGLVATRSIGQFSTLYGGIEDMVVGLEAVFPGGQVTRIKNVPRRAAGPDIRHVVIGNEGALCFITEVTVKLFPYFPENNTFLGWTLKDMKTGFEVLRAVMVSGYKPSVARVYDPGDAGLHFSHFAADDDCVLLFMVEGPAGIATATPRASRPSSRAIPECTPVDSAYIETWFNDLCWGPEQDHRRGRAHPSDPQRQPHHRDLRRLELASTTSTRRREARIIAEIPDITMMGGHSSHSYINGTNMYFNYFFNVVDVRAGGGDRPSTTSRSSASSARRRSSAAARSSTTTGWARRGRRGSRRSTARRTTSSRRSSASFDPNGIMNKGTIIPK